IFTRRRDNNLFSCIRRALSLLLCPESAYSTCDGAKTSLHITLRLLSDFRSDDLVRGLPRSKVRRNRDSVVICETRHENLSHDYPWPRCSPRCCEARREERSLVFRHKQRATPPRGIWDRNPSGRPWTIMR